MNDWRDRARCLTEDPGKWFPEKSGSSRAAKKLCAECPVRLQCLDDALTQDTNPDGVWGGTSPRERAPLRRARRTAA